MAADKKNQTDIHATPLSDLKSEARFAIVLLVFRYLTKDAMDAIDATVRSVRRRWDQLTPSTATVEERREWPPSLAKERAAWDLWFQKFMSGVGTVDQLDEMIQRVNAADRRGAPTVEKIMPISDLLNSILGASAIGAVSRIAHKTNVSQDPVRDAFRNAPQGPALTDVDRAAVADAERQVASGERGKSTEDVMEDVEIARLEREVAAKKAARAARGRVPAPPAPLPFSDEPDTSLYDGMDPPG